MKVDSKTGKHK